tara:strand:+ start:10896 stop:11540 length:645 start_codon:yes stop_codon:yes gene_type:complete
MSLAEFVSYIFTPLTTALAVWIAYLAVSKGSEPQLLAYYQPNPDVPSLIDFVIENIGGGSAYSVVPSVPIPVNCFGIEKPDKDSGSIPVSGFPSVAPGQRLLFNGGQYAGLDAKLSDGLPVTLSYRYRNPLGFQRKGKEMFVLGVRHLRSMPTRTSANQAIVDALKGPNRSTIQDIRNELRAISGHLAAMRRDRDDQDGKAFPIGSGGPFGQDR